MAIEATTNKFSQLLATESAWSTSLKPNPSIYHLKLLIPASATGAIIGKGGSTIAQLQLNSGARVRISKANQLYPGTTERVCLVSGTIDAIIQVNEFIMYKIMAFMAIEATANKFSQLLVSEPAWSASLKSNLSIYHLKLLIPASATGAIIGKGGSTIVQLQLNSGARVRISKANQLYPGTTERVCLVSGTIDAIIQVNEFIMNKILSLS